MGSTAGSHSFYFTDLLGFNVSRGSAVKLTIRLQHGLLFVVRLPFLIAKRDRERYDNNTNCNNDNSPNDTTIVTHNIDGSTTTKKQQ